MNAERIASYVQDWLQAEETIFSSDLMREGFLGIPILNSILADGRRGKIISEHYYPPNLQRSSKDKRKWIAMDFGIVGQNNDSVSSALECKWSNEKRKFKDEVYADTFRLASLSKHGCRNCFLLVAGTSDHIQAIFDTTVPSGLIDGWRAPAFSSFPREEKDGKFKISAADIIGFSVSGRALEVAKLGACIDYFFIRVEKRLEWTMKNGKQAVVIIWKVWAPNGAKLIKQGREIK